MSLVCMFAFVLLAAPTVARADNPTAADDQYNQQPVLTPPTVQSQPPAPQAPAPTPQTVTPSTPAPTPTAAPSTPTSAPTSKPSTKAPAAGKPKAPFTPPSVSQSPPAQTPTQGVSPAPQTTSGLPFTGVSLLKVVLLGLGLIALGAVLRLQHAPPARRS